MKTKAVESVYWAFTLRCNNTCAHCYNDSSPSQPALPIEKALKSVENFPLKINSRVILSGGEPLHPDNRPALFTILDALRKKYGPKIEIWLQTNGDYLNENLLDELLAFRIARFDIASMDSFHSTGHWPNLDEKKRALKSLLHSRGIKPFMVSVSSATRRNILIGGGMGWLLLWG